MKIFRRNQEWLCIGQVRTVLEHFHTIKTTMLDIYASANSCKVCEEIASLENTYKLIFFLVIVGDFSTLFLCQLIGKTTIQNGKELTEESNSTII